MRETEAKLIVKDRKIFDRISRMGHILDFSLKPVGRFLQRDIYYDTADRKLAGCGAVCRIREVDGDKVITFKRRVGYEKGVSEREELEVPLEEGSTDPIQRMRELTGEDLLKVLEVENQRTVFHLVKGDEVHFELVLDDVTFRGHRGTQRYLEIELERKRGSKEDMLKIAEFLKGEFDLMSSPKSKYEIGLEAVG